MMAVDYEWRLRVLMAENGMFRATDLMPRLREHGIRLSDSQVFRLVSGRPERVNLRVLMVLCEILGCELGELVRRTDAMAAAAKTEPVSSREIRKDLTPKRARLTRPARKG
jgi:DNA-binding Xre family transcriptional regulator